MADHAPEHVERIRVLSVDDHPFLAEGLRARLALEPDMEFVGHRTRADDLVDGVLDTRAEVVLMDIELPGLDPFGAIARLRRALPGCRVILLSAYVRDHYVEATVKAGAWGYLSKNDNPLAIIQAVRDVAAGRFTFGPTVLDRCRQIGAGELALPEAASEESGDGGPNPGGPASRLHTLTTREMQVLRMIGKGMSRAEIANAIFRSPKTVDAHRFSIMEKLAIHDRVELARFAIREGLVEI